MFHAPFAYKTVKGVICVSDFEELFRQYERELMSLQKQTDKKEATPPAPVIKQNGTVPLQVKVINEGQLPVENAIVSVCRKTETGKEILAIRITDADGFIEPISLAKNRTYELTATAPHYYRNAQLLPLDGAASATQTLILSALPDEL